MESQKRPDSQDVPVTEEPQKQAHWSNIDYSATSRTMFYADHVQANITLFDVRLLLSNVRVDSERGMLVAEQTLSLFMSPELADLTHTILGRALESYAKQFGRLRPTPHSEPLTQSSPVQEDAASPNADA
jgi:hypothetical protein